MRDGRKYKQINRSRSQCYRTEAHTICESLCIHFNVAKSLLLEIDSVEVYNKLTEYQTIRSSATFAIVVVVVTMWIASNIIRKMKINIDPYRCMKWNRTDDAKYIVVVAFYPIWFSCNSVESIDNMRKRQKWRKTATKWQRERDAMPDVRVSLLVQIFYFR